MQEGLPLLIKLLPPPMMICNKLVHFANVFFGVSTGGVHIDQTPPCYVQIFPNKWGQYFLFGRLERFPFVNWTLWVVFKCVVDEICSKMCFLGSLPQGGSRINLGWIPPR